jgi:hypothetical protein
MHPIRRGDGTGLSVPGITQARKGDGTVLYDGGAAIPDSVVSRPADDDSFTPTSSARGLVIEPSQDWPDIGARISSNTSGLTRAYIYQFSDGTLLNDTDISALSSGDSFTIAGVDLQAGTKYSFVADDADGDGEYTGGWYDSASFPYTSDDGNLSIVASIDGGNVTTEGNSTHAYQFSEIGNVGFN